MNGNSMIPTDRKFDERVLTRICQECGDVLDGLDLEAEQEREDCMCRSCRSVRDELEAARHRARADALLCRSCRSVRDELDLDEGWSTYLASLKPHAVWLVEQLDNRLAGWKCMGGSMTFGQDSKGRRYVDTAKDFRFVAPGHKVEAVFGEAGRLIPCFACIVAPGHKVEAVFGLEGVTLRSASQHHALPEWSVLFSFETPLPVILAACAAAVTAE